MVYSNQTSRPEATVAASGTPTIYNVTCTLANTEYSQSVSTGTKKFLIRVRGIAEMRLAFDVADTDDGNMYVTVPHGCSYTEEALLFNGTLYFRTNKPAQVVEIVEWI